MEMNEKYPLALPKGTVLAGQYIIESVLGQGGFGITYKATDHKTGQNVAVKEFFPDSMATRTQTTVTAFSGERGESFTYGKSCFLQEAETLAEFIGNENIVRVHSYFEENGTAYFVMDFIEGTSFDNYIKERGGKISYEDAERILLPIMDALDAVHARGIVHRDVTPDNIYITKDNKVKLLDFGAARYSLGDKSRSLDVVLKHGFAPKEQYTRHGKQGPFTDVYAVGATLYFAITGRRPPDSIDRLDEDELIPPSRLGAAIPKMKEDALLFALNVQPQARFQSMGAFRNALSSSTPVVAAKPQPQSQTPPQPQTPQPQVQQRYFEQPKQPQQVPVSPQQTVSQTPPMRAQQIPVQPQQTVSQTPPMRAQQIPVQPQQPVSQTPPMRAQQIPVQPQQTVSQTPPVATQGEKKNKWILPVGIGACVVGVVAIVIGIVLAVGGIGDKEQKTAKYDTDDRNEDSYVRPNNNPVVDTPTPDTEPETQYTEPETQYTEPETQYTEPEPEPVVASGREIIGNNPNNISNRAMLTTSGSDIYMYYPGCGLVQVTEDAVNKLDATGEVSSISVVGDLVYYIDHSHKACSIKTDGTGITYVSELYDYEIDSLWVTEDGFFFKDNGSDDCYTDYYDTSLRKVVHFLDTNTGKLESLYNGDGNCGYAFMGDYIYFVSALHQELTIARVPRTNLEAEEEVVYTISGTDKNGGDYVQNVIAADNVLYCIYKTCDENGNPAIHLFGIDLSTGTPYIYLLVEGSDVNIGSVYIGGMNVYGDYIYLTYDECSNELVELYRIKTSDFLAGTINPEMIYTEEGYTWAGELNLLPEEDSMTVYQYNSRDSVDELMILNLDGSGDPVIFSEKDNY